MSCLQVKKVNKRNRLFRKTCPHKKEHKRQFWRQKGGGAVATQVARLSANGKFVLQIYEQTETEHLPLNAPVVASFLEGTRSVN